MACNDKCNPKPPKWELPQPIDESLIGSWESEDGYIFITFYENNKCIIKSSYFVEDNEYRWSVNGNKIVLPDFYEHRSGYFAEYTYSLSEDKNLLYVKFIDYSMITGNCNFTFEGTIMPLGGNDVTYKRLEDEFKTAINNSLTATYRKKNYDKLFSLLNPGSNMFYYQTLL